MGILRRLKNLWNLSSIEIPKDTDVGGSGLFTKILEIGVKRNHAKIVDMTNPIEELKLD